MIFQSLAVGKCGGLISKCNRDFATTGPVFLAGRPYNVLHMRCSDTLLAFATFFCFGIGVAIWPNAFRDAQLFLRSQIPFADWMPGGQLMRTQGYVSLIRWQGVFFAGHRPADQSSPTGMDCVLWALCPLGADSRAALRQSDARGMGDA